MKETPKRSGVKKTPRKYPRSQGYLVFDSKKCSGCCSCMLACSLVHEGQNNQSLARIQITQDVTKGFPDDININICRQCVYPICLEVCPTGALHVDTLNGNIRVIEESKCTGCKLCFNSCPYIPSRIVWNNEKKVAMKCDLCINTPFWENKGGPDGTQACVQACPLKALKLVKAVPEQRGNLGYDLNLRTETWAKLGLPVD